VIDRHWINHIDDMTYLRDKVGLYGYAQQDPLVIYKKEAFEKFQKLLFNIQKEILARTLRTNFEFLKQTQENSEVITLDS
jgi:preprotein translocase subunit SecA